DKRLRFTDPNPPRLPRPLILSTTATGLPSFLLTPPRGYKYSASDPTSPHHSPPAPGASSSPTNLSIDRSSFSFSMAVDLTPRQPAKAYGGDGGAYYEWSPAELPMLGIASIGAAKLALAAGGMSLPSYSDSAKVAYVLQGMR
uniref:Cupin type-1 domain-containing protein n=1 Tax=Aegilops tauschii subsp. strangulata TaxID=200361 RepID=A0A452XQ76_AEGTS